MKRKLDHGDGGAEQLAVAVLRWLTEDEARLHRFVQLSGLTSGTLRESARDPGFLAAVLDYVVSDEAVLITCAEALATHPQRIAAAWQRLQPPEFDPSL